MEFSYEKHVIVIYKKKVLKLKYTFKKGMKSWSDWQELLTKVGIPGDPARTYAETLVKESFTKDSLTIIDQ